ncbi:MAG: OmpA family protein [Cyclobacteriaceae bacterium]|nr:OmpA family protein [Cyclobacteriaceae bacterium]
MRVKSWAFGLIVLFCSACVRGAFQPVNVGREYGDKVPIMVSHLSKRNPGSHYPLQQILCFDYMCRKGVGRKRAMRAISYEDFRKRVRQNAKKGVYKDLVPKPGKVPVQPPVQTDSLVAPGPVPIVEQPFAPERSLLKQDSLITLGELLFETNSHHLRKEHYAGLDSLAEFLVARPRLEVRITGHTDNTGEERHNVALSTRRAEAVAEYLREQGVDFDHISFEGMGSSVPIADNRSSEGRKKNRRVEVLITDPDHKK